MPADASIRDHKAWIGYLQPEGLVVSPAALVDAQVAIDRGQMAARQQEFQVFVSDVPHGDEKTPAVTELDRLLRAFLGWPDDLLYGASLDRPIPDALKIPLRDFGETLEPTFALRHARPDDPEHPWLLLVDQRPPQTDLDQPVESKLAGWSASPTRRFERLLREAEVPVGLISNGRQLRLVYAPRGENASTLTFPVAAMSEIAGRPILAAFDMLLSRYRLLAAPSEARLPTPRSLTEPIVRTTLKPILERLRPHPACLDGEADGVLETSPALPSRPHPACPDGEGDSVGGAQSKQSYSPSRQAGWGLTFSDSSSSSTPSGSPSAQGGWGPTVAGGMASTPTPDQILSLKICDPAMGSGAFLVEACRQLADALVGAWAAHGYKPYIPPDEDEVLHARRLIAQRCLYGVDRNPMAVDLAKLSLWLATLAKDHPFTFLDHNLRCGDSLVGLSRRQIVGFDLEPSAQLGFVEAKVRERMERAAVARKAILEAGDDLPPAAKQQKLALADEQLDLVRLVGDTLVASFFAGDKPRARKQLRDDYFNLLDRWLQRSDPEARQQLRAAVRGLRGDNSLSLRERAGVRAASAAFGSPSSSHPARPDTHADATAASGPHPARLDGERDGVLEASPAPPSRPHPARPDGEGDSLLGAQSEQSYSPSRQAGWGLTTEEAASSSTPSRSPSAQGGWGPTTDDRTATRSVSEEPGRENPKSKIENPKSPLTPFHWEIEFPEVFAREASGFDAIVGNPPFAGKKTLIAGHRAGYLDWLKAIHDESHGNADLVAHFFRRAFNLLKPDGCFGLIATNTVEQGDTRSTGLRWICTHGGTIYAARKRYKWPGLAAVVVSVVHVSKGQLPPPYLLDGRQVPIITAYLFHAGGHDSPQKLQANEGKSFQGTIVLGIGFTFDDTATDGIANPISEMHRLIENDPRNAERIFPYIGGEEVNDSANQSHYRYIINYGELSEAEARRWPDLMQIVESRVKPQRMSDNRELYRRNWWQYAEKRSDLWSAVMGIDRVLVRSLTSKHHSSFAFLDNRLRYVYDQTLIVFATCDTGRFAVMCSRAHEAWSLFFGATLEDRPRYNVALCFETFPFPCREPALSELETAGREYYEFRAALMVRNNEGLTKTYNRFHDPGETSPDIQRLRELHDAMDRAVLDAYGWTDLRPVCDFLLDFDDEDEADDEPPARARQRQRRKPWRDRWPDDIRDEVLARLLKLNAERAEQERRTGAAAAANQPRRRRGRASRQPPELLQ